MLKTTFVKADLMRRIRIVREYLEQKFFTPGEKKNLDVFLESQGEPKDEQSLITTWGDDFFSSFSATNAYDYLEYMTSRVKDIPVVNLYVPVELDFAQTMKIGQWFRENVDTWLLIEFHQEPATFGGCAYAWNGTYHDYSFHHAIHTHIKEIRSVLDTFAKEKNDSDKQTGSSATI